MKGLAVILNSRSEARPALRMHHSNIQRYVVPLATFLFLVSAAVPRASAAPVITGIADAASNITVGHPLAPGEVFVIFGSGLGPATLTVAPTAFASTTLAGTSVNITSGATTLQAPMYYTSDKQVAALLPSSIPTTSGLSITVTYNGQTSGPSGHGIANSSFGILTLDSSGLGPAIITNPDFSLVSANRVTGCGGSFTSCGAANPGDTLILWGTGLGAVSGNELAGAGLGQNMLASVPLDIFVGGVQAQVIYAGRSGCCVGEDQVVFTVPSTAPTGCSVPLVARITVPGVLSTISNSTVLPIAKSGRDCSPNDPAIVSTSTQQFATTGIFNIANVELQKFYNFPGTGYGDKAQIDLLKVPFNTAIVPFVLGWADEQPTGTCLAFNNGNPGLDPPVSNNDLSLFDGGTSFTVKGPNGTVAVTGVPGESKATLSPTGAFLVPGTYTVSGNGGKDIGPFTANITVPPALSLTSPTSGATVTKTNGLPVSWTGGGTGNVIIRVFSSSDANGTLVYSVRCVASASDGTFTIPGYVMQSLFTGNFNGITIAPGKNSVPFTVSGANLGYINLNFDGVGFGFGTNTNGALTLR